MAEKPNRSDDEYTTKYCLFLGWVSSLSFGGTAELLGTVFALFALLTGSAVDLK
jgi:hypothetical protein